MTGLGVAVGLMCVASSLLSCHGQVLRPTADCPSAGSVVVSQTAPAARPSGQTSLTCEFQVAAGQFIFFSWILHETNVGIYNYVASESPPETIADTDLVVSVDTDIRSTGGTSVMVINAEVTDNRTYKCDVYVQNLDYCIDLKKIVFEDPPMEIQSNGIVIANRTQCSVDTLFNNNNTLLIAGVINNINCVPSPNLTLSINQVGGVDTTVSNVVTETNPQGYCRATVSTSVTFADDGEISIEFNALEDRGTDTILTHTLPCSGSEAGSSTQRGGCNSGCITGVVIAVIIIIALVVFIAVIFRRRYQTNKKPIINNGSATNIGYSPGKDPENGLQRNAGGLNKM